MTLEPPASSVTRPVRVCGPTVAAAILADRLREVGYPVVAGDLSAIDPNLLKLATDASRSALARAGFEAVPIQRHYHRQLSELDFCDSEIGGPPVYAVRLRKSTTASHSFAFTGDTSSVLTVKTVYSLQGGYRMDHAAVNLTLELQWPRAKDIEPFLCEMSGEHLDEVSALTTVISVTDLTSLVLTVPMAILVSHSIAIADIAYRLLDHAGVRDLLPGASLIRAASYMTLGTPITPVEQYSTSSLHIGAAAGFADPVFLDREVNSAIRTANALENAFHHQRWTGASLSRLTRR